MFPLLDQYQIQAYGSLLEISKQHRGALLCDGVGLGKTFVGLLLIERLIMRDRKRVALLVPKSGRIAVWERSLRKYLPHLGGDFTNLAIFNHTDLMRTSADMPCPYVGEKHKHRWDETVRDKEAYVPPDITALVKDPVGVWKQFCEEAKIQHTGNMLAPPQQQLDLL